MSDLQRCCKKDCRDVATWFYMPDTPIGPFCDAHVPRGCSCVDDGGPCCEWAECPDGRLGD